MSTINLPEHGGYYDDAGKWHNFDDETAPQTTPEAIPETPPSPAPAAGMSRAEWRATAVPTTGFRAFVYKATGGIVNLGPSKKQIAQHETERAQFEAAQQALAAAEAAAEQRRNELISTMDRPVKLWRVTVTHEKGGMGKTTTTIALGTVFAMFCRIMACAVDGNPDRGNLANRVGRESTRTIRDLIAQYDSIEDVNALRAYLSQAKSRLEVLASDDNPKVSRALTPQEYTRVQELLATYRQLILTDTGTDTTSPVLPAIMELTDTLVVASDVTPTAQAYTSDTLDLWEAQAPNGEDLVRNAIVVVRLPNRALTQDQLAAITAKYDDRVGAVVFIPFDDCLAVEGNDDTGTFVWDDLSVATQDAYLELGAAVARTMTAERSAHSPTASAAGPVRLSA